MQDSKYICVCGKEFKSVKSLSAHKSSCKEWYLKRDENLDKYYLRLENHKNKMIDFGLQLSMKNLEVRNARERSKLEVWVNEKHTCERCGHIMTEKFGSGRFCSRFCANSRKHSKETKEKISKALTKNEEITQCLDCRKLIRPNRSGLCKNCYLHKPLTEEHKKKLSDVMKAKGYPRWNIHRNEPSYAEKFWMDVLKNNNIEYSFEFRVKNHKKHHYILDFFIEKNNCKIDLEIDGKQHLEPERILHDSERDTVLSSKCFIVYRVSWNSINTEFGKQEMKTKIDNFLKFYNSL